MENELRRKYESIRINELKNGFGAGKPFICFVPASRHSFPMVMFCLVFGFD